MYIKVQQYEDNHGINPGSTYYYVRIFDFSPARNTLISGHKKDRAVDIQQGIQKTWLSSSGCGGGGTCSRLSHILTAGFDSTIPTAPQTTDGTAPNTITTHLYFSLTVALALYKPSDTDMVSTAHTVC